MIKNIVFDMCHVLVDVKQKDYLIKLGIDINKVDTLVKIIFRNNEWKEYDLGKYSFNELKENVINNNPTYKKDLEYIFNNFDFNAYIFENKEATKLLKELKELGYHIYILSNLNNESLEAIKKYGIDKYFNGGVYSFEVGCAKPDIRIFNTLFNKYNINPKECIFIDDTKKNIDVANSLGMKGILFTSTENTKKELFKIIKK